MTWVMTEICWNVSIPHQNNKDVVDLYNLHPGLEKYIRNVRYKDDLPPNVIHTA